MLHWHGMTALQLTLFGSPQVLVSGVPVALRNKARAVLFCLAAAESAQSRRVLAGRLWSEQPSDLVALERLRGEVHALRHALPDGVLEISAETVALNPHAVTSDFTTFSAVARRAQPSLAECAQALPAYAGPFLDGFELELKGADGYVEWLLEERRHWETAWLRLLRTAAQRASDEQDAYALGTTSCRHLLALHPDDEPAHRLLMKLLALDGQREAALAQYQECLRALRASGLPTPAAATTALAAEIEAGRFAARPPAVQVVAPPQLVPPFQAPAVPAWFVGRTAAVERLRTWLQSERVVALVGMGGIGKTTLAAALAHDLRHDFPDGVLWAGLGTADPLEVLHAWARVFGYNFDAIRTLETCAAAVRGMLDGKRVLVVLDDVDLEGRLRADQVRALLPAAPGVALLTARDRDLVGLLGAREFPVEQLAPAAAVTLLRRVLGDDRVEREADAASTIGAVLEHHPLALEITARRLARIPDQPLAIAAGELQAEHRRLDRLRIGDLSVRASIALSWRRLDAEKQAVFAACGFLRGDSFGAAAVAAIASLAHEYAEEALFDLAALSLVTYAGSGRFRQHVLLADFAREQVADAAIARRRLVDFYRHFAETNRANYAALEPEWENLLAAIRTAHALQAWQAVIDLAAALSDAWFTRARYAEMRQGYDLALDAIAQIGNHAAQQAEFERMWGQACLEQSDFAEAQQHFGSSLEIYRGLGDQAGLAGVMVLLGRLARDRNEHEESDQWLQDAEELLRKLDDAPGLAQIAHSRAWLLHHAGDNERAEQLALHALAEYERLGDEKHMVAPLQLLTIIKRWARRDTVAARAYGERARQLADQLQDRNAAAISLVHLSAICYSEGRAGEGQQLAELAAADLERMGDRKACGVALYWLSVNLEKLEAFEKALQHGLEALALFQALPSPYDEVMTMLHLGDLLVALHRPFEARQIWADALEIGLVHNRAAVPDLRVRLAQLSDAG